jgi:hypothetical protein
LIADAGLATLLAVAGVVIALSVVWVAYTGFSASPRSDFPWKKRRSHFWARVVLACLLGPLWLLLLVVVELVSPLPKHVLTVAAWATAYLWLPAIAAAPALYYQRSQPSPGTSEDDGGGGGGRGPDPPAQPPTRPRGGIPLPDAAQALTRVRDHNRPRLREAPARRAPREPTRVPTRTGLGGAVR